MTTKLHAMTAGAVFAALFYVGCGDDDSNEAPGKGGSTSASGGKSSGGGGATSNGGKPTTNGGKPSTNGGTTGDGGTSGGAGGEPPVVNPEGGSGGVPPVTSEGGAGAGGMPGDILPVLCSAATLNPTLKCYENCTPTKTTDSEQFLNHCTDLGVECTKFDNSTLTKLGTGGALPPLP